jgi:hypothetical protein
MVAFAYIWQDKELEFVLYLYLYTICNTNTWVLISIILYGIRVFGYSLSPFSIITRQASIRSEGCLPGAWNAPTPVRYTRAPPPPPSYLRPGSVLPVGHHSNRRRRRL